MTSTGLMEGAKEALEAFRRAGLTQIIVSASHTGELSHFSRLFGVEGYFRWILGAEDFQAAGKVEMACQFLQEQGIAPEECVVIGDTLHDREMAKAIGCPVCLLDRGHQSRAQLESAGEPVFHHLEDAASWILKRDSALKFDIRLGFRYNKQESIPPRRRARRI